MQEFPFFFSMLASSFGIVFVCHKYFEILYSGKCKIKHTKILKSIFFLCLCLLRVVLNKLNVKETILVSGYVTEMASVSSQMIFFLQTYVSIFLVF